MKKGILIFCPNLQLILTGGEKGVIALLVVWLEVKCWVCVCVWAWLFKNRPFHKGIQDSRGKVTSCEIEPQIWQFFKHSLSSQSLLEMNIPKEECRHTHTEFHRMTSWSGPRKTWHHFLVLGVFDGSPLGRGGADGLEPKKAFPFGSPSLHSAAFVCTLSRTRARIKTSTHTRQTALQMRTEEVRFELLSQTDKNRLSEDSIWNIQSLILSNPWLMVAFCASFTLITELQGWKEKPLPGGNNLHRRSCFKWSSSYTSTAHSLLSWFVWWL